MRFEILGEDPRAVAYLMSVQLLDKKSIMSMKYFLQLLYKTDKRQKPRKAKLKSVPCFLLSSLYLHNVMMYITGSQ